MPRVCICLGTQARQARQALARDLVCFVRADYANTTSCPALLHDRHFFMLSTTSWSTLLHGQHYFMASTALWSTLLCHRLGWTSCAASHASLGPTMSTPSPRMRHARAYGYRCSATPTRKWRRSSTTSPPSTRPRHKKKATKKKASPRHATPRHATPRHAHTHVEACTYAYARAYALVCGQARAHVCTKVYLDVRSAMFRHAFRHAFRHM